MNSAGGVKTDPEQMRTQARAANQKKRSGQEASTKELLCHLGKGIEEIRKICYEWKERQA